MKETIVCAAVWYPDAKNSWDYETHGTPDLVDGLEGIVIAGKRHHDCLHIAALMGLDKYNERPMEEGFLTSTRRFVNRTEAAKIAYEMKQVDKKYNYLFSEHLY